MHEIAPFLYTIEIGKLSNLHVIASQLSNWRGNPFSFMKLSLQS